MFQNKGSAEPLDSTCPASCSVVCTHPCPLSELIFISNVLLYVQVVLKRFKRVFSCLFRAVRWWWNPWLGTLTQFLRELQGECMLLPKWRPQVCNMPLPFGLKLKRTRRYTVSSKSCLVTRIQLLNGEFVEFTLSVESTGQECLEAVAQRLELREVCVRFPVIQVTIVLTCVHFVHSLLFTTSPIKCPC